MSDWKSAGKPQVLIKQLLMRCLGKNVSDELIIDIMVSANLDDKKMYASQLKQKVGKMRRPEKAKIQNKIRKYSSVFVINCDKESDECPGFCWVHISLNKDLNIIWDDNRHKKKINNHNNNNKKSVLSMNISNASNHNKMASFDSNGNNLALTLNAINHKEKRQQQQQNDTSINIEHRNDQILSFQDIDTENKALSEQEMIELKLEDIVDADMNSPTSSIDHQHQQQYMNDDGNGLTPSQQILSSHHKSKDILSTISPMFAMEENQKFTYKFLGQCSDQKMDDILEEEATTHCYYINNYYDIECGTSFKLEGFELIKENGHTPSSLTQHHQHNKPPVPSNMPSFEYQQHLYHHPHHQQQAISDPMFNHFQHQHPSHLPSFGATPSNSMISTSINPTMGDNNNNNNNIPLKWNENESCIHHNTIIGHNIDEIQNLDWNFDGAQDLDEQVPAYCSWPNSYHSKAIDPSQSVSFKM